MPIPQRINNAPSQRPGDTFLVIILIIFAVLALERKDFSPRSILVADEFVRLIAIMLGRFRMTVPDCISEYETLGQEVFGKPRFFTTLRFGVGNKTKYRANELKKVFENVTERRSEQSSHGRVKFPSERGLCRTSVLHLFLRAQLE